MMYELPTSVEIQGVPFKIRNKGDFRMVLSCFKALKDKELSNYERLMASLIIFYEDLSDIDDFADWSDEKFAEAIEQMYKFFDANQPSVEQTTHDYNLIDWEADEMLICSAVNNVAQKEVRAEEYLHWWTFLGYYMAIGECALSSIVNIRYKTVTGKKLEKYELQYRADNPQYFKGDYRSTKQQEADEFVKSIWNK